jgi:hypothetical protein
MTIDQYWAAVRRLGLHATKTPGVYMTSRGDVFSVRDPTNRTPEERVDMLEMLKMLMGIGPASGRYDA